MHLNTDSSKAWPHWMLRFVAANENGSLSDLIDSVTAEPPYGQVSASEAKAILSVIESHQNEVVIPDSVYQSALKLIQNSPEKSSALDAFRLHDRIASSPADCSADAAEGSALAERLCHDGLRARFLSIQANSAYQDGNLADALRMSASACDLFRTLAVDDSVYESNWLATGTNTASFSLMEGDFETARRIYDEITENFGVAAVPALGIGEQPQFPTDLKLVSDTAGEYLESGDTLRALEWYQEAARIAGATEQESQLCGILGDLAVAFRRIGNVPRAMKTYEEALRISRKHSDWENLSRWSQNLGMLILERDDIEGAAICLKEGLRAAALSGVPYQISMAAGNYTGLLARQQRYREAIESLDQAAAAAGDKPDLAAIWQTHRVSVLLQWGKQLREEGQTNNALEVFQKAVEAANLDEPEGKKFAAFAWTNIAELLERGGQLEEASASISRAASLYRELGDEEYADELDALAHNINRPSRTVSGTEVTGLDPEELEKKIHAAASDGDVQAEATARMNFVSALRLSSDPRVAGEFENTLALVRRLRDRRRELILCLNFATYFLEQGKVKRAMTLADRSVKLAEFGSQGSMIYALANRGEVWMKGMNETGQALKDFRECAELLREYMQQRPEDKEVPRNVSRPLLEGAQLAARSGDLEGAVAIGAIFNPELAALLTQYPREQEEEPPPPVAQLQEEIGDPLDMLFNHATNLSLGRRLDEAISEFERGFELMAARESPYASEGHVRMNFARTLVDAGQINRSIVEMKKAVVCLEAYRDKRGLHDALSWLAAMYVEDDTEGRRYSEQALALSRGFGDDEALAVDLAQLGQNRLLAGKADEAVGPLEEAVRLSGRNDIKSTLAQVLTGVGKTAEARKLYEELIASADASDPRRRASLFIGLSEVLKRAGDADGALDLLLDARDLTADLTDSKESVFVANHLGLALLKLGRLEQAAQIFEEGITRARVLGLWRIELSLLSNFGNALKELGDLDGAESVLTNARERCRARGIINSEAVALASLGNVSITRGDLEGALARFQEAADLAQEVDDSTEATCVDSLGGIYTQLGKPARAVEYHQRAAELHERLNEWEALLVDFVNIGQTYLALEENSAAEKYLRKANDLAQERKLSLWGLPFLAGQVSAREGRWDEARNHFREAIKAIESIRGSLPTPAAQRQWAASKANIYRLAVEAALSAGDGEAGVEFIECGRARYLKAILERRGHRPAGIDDETWLRYERAADRHALLRARSRSQIAEGNPPTEQEFRDANAELKIAAAPIEAAAAAAASDTVFEFPEFAKLVDRVAPGQVAVWVGTYGNSLGIVWAGKDIAGRSWSAGALSGDELGSALHTVIFGNATSIDSARREGTALDDLPAGEGGFLLAAHFFGQDVMSLDVAFRMYGFLIRDSEILFIQTLEHTCRWLGEHLWPVIESRLPDGTRDVILLPSEALNLLPLHAALRPSGKRIDESYRIRYLPSLAMITGDSTMPRKVRLGQVVNPSVDADLPFSMEEANLVSRSFDADRISRLDGMKATAKRVLALLKKSEVFHFAGHAFYDVSDPFRSGLICSGKRKESEVLTIANVLEGIQSIPSRLVVLSACETGQVEPTDKLEDFLGLPGAFMVAGAQTVIASLWRVDDLAACLLIDKFFEIWERGRVDSGEALSAAQRWLRSEVTVSHVVSRLSEWKERSGDGELQAVLWNWIAREDQDGLAFPHEVDWAAFYLTGLLPGAAA